jgi:hypothetical protein
VLLRLLIDIFPHEARDRLPLVEGLSPGRRRERKVKIEGETKMEREEVKRGDEGWLSDLNQSILVDVAGMGSGKMMFGYFALPQVEDHSASPYSGSRSDSRREEGASSTMSPMERYSMDGISSRKRAKNLMMSMSTAISFFTCG